MGFFDDEENGNEKTSGIKEFAKSLFNDLSKQARMDQAQTIRMSAKWVHKGHEIVVNASHPEILVSAVESIKKNYQKGLTPVKEEKK